MTQVDRRFGSINTFGTSNKFGASTMDARLAWGIEVDWDGDGVFDGTNEAIYACGLTISRGRTAMLRSTGQGFEPMRTGQARITLYNRDGRYDGWNTSSPLYPYVTPGKDVRIRVRDLTAATETIENVFYGIISDIATTGYDTDPKVNIYVDDLWNYLRNYSPRVALQSSISISDAIDMVLDSVDWQTRWGRSLATTSDTVRYWWGSGDKSAASECEDLSNSAFGNFYVGADGSANFITRTTIGTSQADFDQGDLYKDIFNPQPWVNYRNITQIRVHVRDSTGTALLYEQFGEAVQIASGETYVDFVSYTYNGVPVPAVSIITPVVNVDYTINSNSSGSGSDLSGSCTVTVTNLGDRAKRKIVNSGGSTAYVVTFKVRGTAVYERNVADLTYPNDPDSTSKPRKFFMDLVWQQNVNTAQDFCTLYGPFLDAQHPFPVIKVESRFSKQFGLELFDIVTLTASKLGIDGVAFRIGGIEHEVQDANMQRTITTFYLEPYVASGTYGSFPMTFGTSTFGW